MLIQIQENNRSESGNYNIDITFNKNVRFQVVISNPHTAQTEENLEWYFESYINEPYIAEPKVEKEKQRIIDYGVRLFEQLFVEEEAYTLLRKGVNEGLEKLSFEIISKEGSLEFQSILWETLRDPQEMDAPFAARGALFYRKSLKQSTMSARVDQHPEINLLIVTARPSEDNDVGYRTIQRPLVDIISDNNFPVNPYILRPGTFQALKDHLMEVKSGHYHIVHFDLHGEVLEYKDLLRERKKGAMKFSYNHSFGKPVQTFQIRYGRIDIKKFDGKQAFLFFETGKKGEAEPASAKEIATLIRDYQIPVAILNACQSAKQKGDSNETSLAKFLQEHGVDLVLAMRYSVSVSAAKLMMERLYQELFNNKPIGEAISLGRRRLFDEKDRSASMGYTIELEDWVLPVIYQGKEVNFDLRKPTMEEEVAKGATRDKQKDFPKPRFGFYGRDLDILKMEKMLLHTNHLLLRGMIGVGKSELLKYLTAWWSTTKFRNVNNVFYFDFSTSISTEEFVDTLTDYLFTKDYIEQLKEQDFAFRQRKVFETLNQKSYALMIDNIFRFSNKAIIEFLSKLTGKSFVVYGSVNSEVHLESETFQENVYQLDGLDKDAAYQLAKRIIQVEAQKDIQQLVKENQFEVEHLLKLLAGFPSAMELVLPQLKRKPVEEVLEEFRKGTLDIVI